MIVLTISASITNRSTTGCGYTPTTATCAPSRRTSGRSITTPMRIACGIQITEITCTGTVAFHSVAWASRLTRRWSSRVPTIVSAVACIFITGLSTSSMMTAVAGSAVAIIFSNNTTIIVCSFFYLCCNHYSSRRNKSWL